MSKVPGPGLEALRKGQKYWSSRQASEYLGFPNLRSFLLRYHTLGIPTYRLGRSLRFLQADLDAAVKSATVAPPIRRVV